MSLCSCPGGFRISIPNGSSTHIDIGVYMVTNNLALFWVFYIVSCKFQWHTFQYIKVLTWEGRKMSSSLIVEWRDKLIAFWKENIQCTVYIAAHFRSMQNFWHLKIHRLISTAHYSEFCHGYSSIGDICHGTAQEWGICCHDNSSNRWNVAMISIAVVLLVYFFTKYPEKFKYLHGS